MTMAISSGAYTASMGTMAAALGGAAGGLAGGLIASGGDLKAGLIGALTGGAAGFVGASSAFSTLSSPAGSVALRAIGHGVVGGISSRLQGGRFVHGFMSSAFTKAVSGKVSRGFGADKYMKRVTGAITAGIIGGTASRLGSGSFANGAQTSAFQYLFNEVSEVFTRAIKDVPRMFSQWFKDQAMIYNPEERVVMGDLSIAYSAAALTTPCTVVCGLSALAIDVRLSLDSLVRSKYYEASSTALPYVVQHAIAGKVGRIAELSLKAAQKTGGAAAIATSISARNDYQRDN
ncbi:hypothetical protein [Amphritea pacifica]|uniref:Uncharacterized protein n=1 Tax=Amphritea pacifica TaxID=2811233 RepID=A0ABS2WDV8_9GAMM|nr:hypothetical protein [Amphritea pacifica]MBN0989879.1 hypothetical protein [Amphritea pacifica]